MMIRSLGVSMLCGVAFLSLVSPAQAETITEDFEFNFRGKAWCHSSSDSSFGEFENFNETNTKTKIGAAIRIKRDPSNSGDLTELEATLSNRPGGTDPLPSDLTSITMTGSGLLANKSGNSAEFVLHGVNGTDSGTFFTMRGKASLDTKNPINNVPSIKNASGKWIAAVKDDGNPSEHCFAEGTFQTGKKIVP